MHSTLSSIERQLHVGAALALAGARELGLGGVVDQVVSQTARTRPGGMRGPESPHVRGRRQAAAASQLL